MARCALNQLCHHTTQKFQNFIRQLRLLCLGKISVQILGNRYRHPWFYHLVFRTLELLKSSLVEENLCYYSLYFVKMLFFSLTFLIPGSIVCSSDWPTWVGITFWCFGSGFTVNCLISQMLEKHFHLVCRSNFYCWFFQNSRWFLKKLCLYDLESIENLIWEEGAFCSLCINQIAGRLK